MLKGGLPMLHMPPINKPDSNLLRFVMHENYKKDENYLQGIIEDEYIKNNKIIELDEDLNYKSKSGVTVLMACAYRGFETEFDYLLEKGYAKYDAKAMIDGRLMDAFDIAQDMGLYYKSLGDESKYAPYFRMASYKKEYDPIFVSNGLLRKNGLAHKQRKLRSEIYPLYYTLGHETEKRKHEEDEDEEDSYKPNKRARTKK
jgi:hypothetical protein